MNKFQVFWIWCAIAGMSLACGLINLQPLMADTPGSEQVFDSRQVDLLPAKVETYTVTGDDEDELRQQMNELGPIADDGIRYDAVTRWWVEWEWPTDMFGGCDLENVDVRYSITVTMPYWNPPPETSASLVQKWNRYLEALSEHEKTHVENVTVYVPLVKEAVANATCDSANAAAYAVLDDLRDADRIYDEETRHGNTQGALFP
jgi:predicted secreted Zn-dependent protease